MDDFSEFEQMKRDGSSPHEVYLAAKSKGYKFPACVRIVRDVFGFTLVEAKEVSVVADGLGTSLSDYQGKVFHAIEKAIDEALQDDDL